MYKFETEHFKPVYLREKNNIFADLQNFKPAEKRDPANRKSDWVGKSQILKLPHFCRMSAKNLHVCDLKNLFTDCLTFIADKNVFLPYFDWNDGGVS
jgi:hypothetical protein